MVFHDGVRRCRCGTRLARDNRGTECTVCLKAAQEFRYGPPVVPPSFWDEPAMRNALASQAMGQVMRVFRQHPFHEKGIAQQVAAGWVGISQSRLSRIENGEPVDTLAKLVRWAQVLRIPTHLRWFAGPGVQARPTGTAPSTSRPVMTTIIQLRQQIESLDQQYDRVPPASLLTDAGQVLEQIGLFGEHVPDDRVQMELRQVEAEAATLMGQLVWDASRQRDHDEARAHFDTAIEAAQEVGNTATEGHALLRKSYVSLYGEHDPCTGLTLARQAAAATSGTSNVLTGIAQLHAAEALAMLDDQHACEKALAEAEVQFGQANEQDAERYLLNTSKFDRMAGSRYLSLGKHVQAQRVLEIPSQGRPGNDGSNVMILGGLGISYLRQGELKVAVRTLREAIDMLGENRGDGAMNIVFDAARELRPWRTEQSAREVYDRLLVLITTA
jgi:transcriptional regulator with XRE-family HTH domain